MLRERARVVVRLGEFGFGLEHGHHWLALARPLLQIADVLDCARRRPLSEHRLDKISADLALVGAQIERALQ